MGVILHVFNDTVKMRINSLSNVHTSQRDVFLCCFVTVSCPINAVLACFDVLVSRLLNLLFPAKVRLKYKKVWGEGDGEQQVEGKFYDVAGFISRGQRESGCNR